MAHQVYTNLWEFIGLRNFLFIKILKEIKNSALECILANISKITNVRIRAYKIGLYINMKEDFAKLLSTINLGSYAGKLWIFVVVAINNYSFINEYLIDL